MNAIQPKPQTVTSMTPEYRAFCLARQEMHQRLIAWLKTRPVEADVDAEVEGTLNIMWQLQGLVP